MNYKYTFILILFLYLPLQLIAQSCCDDDDEITLCYLSALDYCGTTTNNSCYDYSLDGSFMENSLFLKLQSPQNFGPNGIVNCDLVLKKLNTIQSTQTIYDCGCDMVFVPVISVNPSNGALNSDTTFMPPSVLAAVYEWSLDCQENLAIVFQGESELWGYNLENANVNPNTQVVNEFSNTIFNGPFGNVSSINQGGGYQGVFTGYPSSGTEILVEDANGNATICLDLATNDIIVGDIGIFCSNGAGPATAGAGINNENDIFICNIFALGCQLAASQETEYQLEEKCPPEIVLLPDGQTTVDFGIYIDTLQDITGCDSIIITTEIVEKTIAPFNIDYSGCTGDGFSVTVNNTVYNQLNPSGQEVLFTNEGCDSLVNINLFFPPLVNVDELIEKCPLEVVLLPNGQTTTDFGIYTDTLQGISGCDSIIMATEIIEKIIAPFDLAYLGCVGDGFSVTVNNNVYNQLNPSGQEVLLTEEGCDSLVNIDLLFNPLTNSNSIVSIEKCPLEVVLLPDGETTVDFGIYIDTLIDLNQCSSIIITTEIIAQTIASFDLAYLGCEGDGFSVTVNNNVYNQLNPSGQELLFTNEGCDSLVNIDLSFSPISNIDSAISITKCPIESVLLPDGEMVSDFGIYIDTIVDFNTCNSVIITTEIIEEMIAPFDLDYSGCAGDGFSVTVNDNLYNELNPSGQELLLTNEGCDSLINIDLFFSPIPSIDTDVIMTKCNVSPFNNSIPYQHSISWTSSDNLSCADCPNPLITSGCENAFMVNVIKGDECTWDFDINVKYDYDIYIPNIFSPNSDGYNDYFSIGLPPDCENDGAFEINIFDRWGGTIFSSEDLFFRWYGTHNSKPINTGIYSYWLKFNCNLYEGHITLIR